MAYFDEIKHDGKLKADSLFAEYDFWQQSYQKAQEAKVVVTNHAYLLTRMEDDHDFVRGKTLVIDEGQKMVLALEQFHVIKSILLSCCNIFIEFLIVVVKACFNNACSKICSLKLAI